MRVKLPSLTSGLGETRSKATEGVDKKRQPNTKLFLLLHADFAKEQIWQKGILCCRWINNVVANFPTAYFSVSVMNLET